MRKAYILISYCIVVTMLSCKEKKEEKTLSKITELENKVVFKIDERTEFFRTIFNIAVQEDLPEDIRPCHTEYLKRVNSQFLKFKNHPIIHWIKKDENIGIDFSVTGLMYKDLKQFEFDTIYKKELKAVGLTIKTLDSIKPLLIDFYQKSEFNQFFNNNKDYYKKAISKIEKQVSKEKLFNKVMSFYQDNKKDLELKVFVELTNNAVNRAVPFYDSYNPKKRAYILGNICKTPKKPMLTNLFLELNNDRRGILYHETSHLFTDKLLKKHIGKLEQYKPICKECKDIDVIDKVDHMIVYPIQALMMKRFDGNNMGDNFFLNKCKDVRKEIYKRLVEYKPENDISFEKVYMDCIHLIRESAK
ncbi:DUF4932 domain-containing protein [Tenacibaculum sp. 190524A02b]|uniref:DUF4932 domain-containing protein n=1 Tax=Tenacibaculum vairaonense TaxID=3137860 RepID=UPI0031FB4F4D